jgi:GH24 family phage-related lysozyme (muramidase)
VVGLTGTGARDVARQLSDIRCRKADARRVLVEVSLPEYMQTTRRAFPGFDVLPLDIQGALVSLVYNRGAGMKDRPGTDNRREMRAIRDLVARGVLVGISDQLRSMKRLWAGQGLEGLLRRRDAEAALVDAAVSALRIAVEAPSGLRTAARRRTNGKAQDARERRAVVLPVRPIGGRRRRRRPSV